MVSIVGPARTGTFFTSNPHAGSTSLLKVSHHLISSHLHHHHPASVVLASVAAVLAGLHLVLLLALLTALLSLGRSEVSEASAFRPNHLLLPPGLAVLNFWCGRSLAHR